MAAGKAGSASYWLLVGGYNMLSSKVKALSMKLEAMTEDSTGGGDTAKEVTPVGLFQAEAKQEGAYFDTTTGYIHDMQAGTPGALGPQSTPRVVCLGFAGLVIGEPFFGFFGAFQTDYEVLSEVGKLTRANMSHLVTGQVDQGVILHSQAVTETADVLGSETGSSVDHTTVPQRVVPIASSATNDQITCSAPHGLTAGDTVLVSGHSGSTPSINSIQTVASVQSSLVFTVSTDITTGGTGGSFVRAGTSNGGVAYIEWTDLTLAGYTNALVTVRHSVDNSTFVDLVAMTAATATRGAERKTAAGTCRRYLAGNLDFTGAGGPASFKYMLGFARNP